LQGLHQVVPEVASEAEIEAQFKELGLPLGLIEPVLCDVAEHAVLDLEAEQSADLVGRKSQFARTPYEDKGAKVRRAVDATAACGARRPIVCMKKALIL
jgi:hypothetical protein